MRDIIYYVDDDGNVSVTTDKDFVETHRLRCTYCGQKFFTQIPVVGINHGMVKCPTCGRYEHDIIDDSKPPDLSDSYVPYRIIGETMKDLGVKIIKEDKNMKKGQKVENQEPKLSIYRMCDTYRGIFKVKDLEPTDMFVLVCDEKQNVYMAVAEEEPKYKTKKAIVKMVTGELSWIEDDTLIHVYRRNGVELHVNEFEYPND